jgi:hypothetical protein
MNRKIWTGGPSFMPMLGTAGGNAAESVAAASPATKQVRADQRRPFDYEQGLLWSGRLP